MENLSSVANGIKTKPPRTVLRVFAEFQDGELPVRIALDGRVAWALLRLVDAGPAGLTTLDEPAPRWSAYIFTLRQLGFRIRTEYERHGGQFSGLHGRYILESDVRIVSEAAP